MEFAAGRGSTLKIERPSERKCKTTQADRDQGCRRPLAALDQKIAPSGVNQIRTRWTLPSVEKIDRSQLLPCPNQTDAPWTFTCETETNILATVGQGCEQDVGASVRTRAAAPTNASRPCGLDLKKKRCRVALDRTSAGARAYMSGGGKLAPCPQEKPTDCHILHSHTA